MPQLSLRTPIGSLTLYQSDGMLTEIAWGWTDDTGATDLLQRAGRQLEEYFAGARRDFDLPLSPSGTDHQRRVWSAMRRIPYGATQTYGALASDIASGPRAVGGACGRNPIAIVIPCHRVIGGDGGLTGYSGGAGTDTKQFLLDLEARARP